MNIEVADRLMKLRKQRGYSQEELASALGISRQAISKWERAESAPDVDNLIALSKLYRVSLDTLLMTGAEREAGETPGFEAAQERGADAIMEEAMAESAKAALLSDANGNCQHNPNDAQKVPNSAPQSDSEGENTFALRYERPDINWKAFPYPGLVVLAYLSLGMFLDLWHPGWLLFMTIPVYYTALSKDGFDLGKVPYPLMVVLIYLILGCGFSLWDPGWLVFLTIPLYYSPLGRWLRTWANLALMGACVVLVYSLLGAMLGSWLRIALAAIGFALCAMGVVETLRNRKRV